MRNRIFWICALLLLLGQATPAKPAHAGLWFLQTGVLGKNITVCFVGSAVADRLDRVQEIIGYIRHFEYAANLRFVTLSIQPLAEAAGPGGNLDSLVCPPAIQLGNGDDYFAGDIRVALSGADVDLTPPGNVHGAGCPQKKVSSDFANGPDELAINRACLYNLKLSNDGDSSGKPWLNHTLHEFGHALGLKHEHARADADAGCSEPGYGANLANPVTDGFVTHYDRHSVMHYKFDSCGINGNYDHTGLSAYDRLTLHILYPEENRVAEFVGARVVRTGEKLSLRSAWKMRGANMAYVAKDFVWKLNGVIVGVQPDLLINAPAAGEYTLEYAYKDLLDRSYQYKGVVRVLTPAAYDRLVGSAVAAQTALFDGVQASYTLSQSPTTVKPVGHITIDFEEDAFDETATLVYAAQRIGNTGGMAHVGLFYDLAARDPLTGDAVRLAENRRYAITVQYDPARGPADLDETALALYYQDGRRWIKEESSVVDPEANTVRATPSRFGAWAVLAGDIKFGGPDETEEIFLPLVVVE